MFRAHGCDTSEYAFVGQPVLECVDKDRHVLWPPFTNIQIPKKTCNISDRGDNWLFISLVPKVL